jgi:hypothetical protein
LSLSGGWPAPLTPLVRPSVAVGLLAREGPKKYDPGMKLQDIEQEALALSERERADLVLSLMNTLAAPEAEVSDEEVLRRDTELEEGSVEPLLHEEFVRRVREERGSWVPVPFAPFKAHVSGPRQNHYDPPKASGA